MECYRKVIIVLVLKNGDKISRTRAIIQERKLNITYTLSGGGHKEKDRRRAQITNARGYQSCQGFLLKYVPVAPFWIMGYRNSEMALYLQSSKYFLEP